MDPTVINGQAGFAEQGASLTVTNSPGAVINWQGFSIGEGETTHFTQQNAASNVLNRVLGPDPSLLLGTLASNGRVFLINPGGIVVGEGARIDVAGLVASSLNLSNDDFASGRLDFAPDPIAGTVENHGAIVTPSGGNVYLVGSNVINSGLIMSAQGDVILAAGQSARLFDSSAPGVRVEVTGSGNIAVNIGEIVSQSGSVGIYAASLRNAGFINADQVVRDAGGRIVLRAAQNVTLEAGSLLSASGEQAGRITVQSEAGTTLMSGTINATSSGTGQSGGSVQVLGDKVGLIGGHIDVSGNAGGGTVLVGGDLNGANPAVQNAAATFMSADSTIAANAIIDGSGGTVVLWSGDPLRVHGSISAHAGAMGGGGGLIETSGAWLDLAGISIDAGAPNGRAGTWLLDPNDITILAGGADVNVTGNPDFTSTDDIAVVSVESIETALNAGTSVFIATSTGGTNAQAGDITIADALTWTHVNGPILTLSAHRDVVANAAVTATTGGFVANAGRDVNLNAAITVTTGSITARGGGNVGVNAVMTVNSGDIVLVGDNDGTGPGAVVGGTVNVNCGSSCITIVTGTLGIRFNPESYASTDAEVTAFGSSLTGGGALDAKAWVFGLADDRLYDGTTVAAVSGLKLDVLGAAPGAALGSVSEAAFDTRHTGSAKLVTYESDFSDPAYELFASFGTPAGTYTARADVLVRPLVIEAVTSTRTYDGTTDSTGAPTVVGLQAGDLLNGVLTQSFASKDVLGEDNSTLIANGVYSVSDGNNGDDYVITVNTATGTISRLGISGAITAADKVYDATPAAVIQTRTLSGVLGSDEVSYVGGAALFDDRNAGTGKTVTGSGLTLAGADAGNYTVNDTALGNATISQAPLGVFAHPQSRVFGTSDPPLTFRVTGLIRNPALDIDETEGLVLSGVLTREPGESVAGGPYAITQGTLTSNGNYTINFIGSLFVITDIDTAAPVPGFNAGQLVFAGVTRNVFYYRPGNFWHVSLNPNNADPGFDVMRGTKELKSRTTRCDSVSGAGYCETWSFPQQF